MRVGLGWVGKRAKEGGHKDRIEAGDPRHVPTQSDRVSSFLVFEICKEPPRAHSRGEAVMESEVYRGFFGMDLVLL